MLTNDAGGSTLFCSSGRRHCQRLVRCWSNALSPISPAYADVMPVLGSVVVVTSCSSRIIVGPTTIPWTVLVQCLANARTPTTTLFPQLQPLPNVGPEIACYLDNVTWIPQDYIVCMTSSERCFQCKNIYVLDRRICGI